MNQHVNFRMLDFAARFEASYIPEPNTGCFLWTAADIGKGYGHIRIGSRKRVKAHRASWLLHRGQIPDGMQVLHKCDQPGCVNPDHLFLGTHTDNMADMSAKKRSRPPDNRGERHGRSKLTDAQALAIQGDNRPLKDVAADYDVSISTVSEIRNRKHWRHLDAG